MGEPRLRGNTYCGPKCGAGCTKQQFDDAKAEAEELATVLGKQWEPVVWENLGWHAEAKLGTANVRKSGRGRHATYRFDTCTSPQFIGHGKTPEEAVKDGLAKMRRHCCDVADLYDKLVAAVRLPDGKPTTEPTARRKIS